MEDPVGNLEQFVARGRVETNGERRKGDRRSGQAWQYVLYRFGESDARSD